MENFDELVKEFEEIMEWRSYETRDLPPLDNLIRNMEYRYKEQEYKSYRIYRLPRPYGMSPDTFIILSKFLGTGLKDIRNPLWVGLKDLVDVDGNEILVDNQSFIDNYYDLSSMATVVKVVCRKNSVDVKILEKGIVGW